MPKIDISQTDKRILQAMADERGTTPEAVLEKILADIRINYAGIHPDDIPEFVEARVAKMEARGKAAKDARTASQAAVLE